MRRRLGWVVTAGLALAPATGCIPGFMDASPKKPAMTESPSSPRAERELPASDRADIFLATARELEKKGDGGRAVSCYERAKSLNPEVSDQIARHLAVLYDKTDEPGKALIEFQRAVKNSPKDADLLNDLGYHWYNCGNWLEAEVHFREALAADAKHGRARMNLGLALAQQGREDEALDSFRQVIGPAEAQSNLGFVLLTQGKREQARTAYNRALTLDPSCKLAQAALAKLAQAHADSDEVRELAPVRTAESATP